MTRAQNVTRLYRWPITDDEERLARWLHVTASRRDPSGAQWVTWRAMKQIHRIRYRCLARALLDDPPKFLLRALAQKARV